MKTSRFVILTVLLLILSLSAQAHTGIGAVHGLIDGLMHTITGVNHLLVMIGIGLWASMRGGRAFWLFPMTFLMTMSVGASLNFAGLTVTAAESYVAFSVLAAGVLVWRNTPMSSALAVAVVAVFALGHGYIHAAELANGTDALAYSAGFLLMTALLLGLGVAVGLSAANALKMIGAGFGLLCTVVGAGLLVGV